MRRTTTFYVFDRHRRYGLSALQMPTDPNNEASEFEPVCYASWQEAALDAGASVAGSVHGTLEIHASLPPTDETLIARCQYSKDGPIWTAGPLAALADGLFFAS